MATMHGGKSTESCKCCLGKTKSYSLCLIWHRKALFQYKPGISDNGRHKNKYTTRALKLNDRKHLYDKKGLNTKIA